MSAISRYIVTHHNLYHFISISLIAGPGPAQESLTKVLGTAVPSRASPGAGVSFCKIVVVAMGAIAPI